MNLVNSYLIYILLFPT